MKTYILLKEYGKSDDYYPYYYRVYFIHEDGITGKSVGVSCPNRKTNKELIKFYNNSNAKEISDMNFVRYEWNRNVALGSKRIL